MISDQLLDGPPAQDKTFDEVTEYVFSQPRVHQRWQSSERGASDGPDEAGALGPGRRAPA